ncbi:hypothetical protein PC122_g19446 [Phytophthora cactorum]|nr:hypothetical protein PC122_g19446 [Phytophthora cactorum]
MVSALDEGSVLFWCYFAVLKLCTHVEGYAKTLEDYNRTVNNDKYKYRYIQSSWRLHNKQHVMIFLGMQN